MIPARCEKPSKCKGVDKTNATVVLQTPQSALGSNCLPTTYFCFQSQSLCPVTCTELWKSKPGRDDSTEISDISTEISDQLFIQAGPQFCVMFLIQAENAFTLKQIECSLKSLKSRFCYCSFTEKYCNVFIAFSTAEEDPVPSALPGAWLCRLYEAFHYVNYGGQI